MTIGRADAAVPGVRRRLAALTRHELRLVRRDPLPLLGFVALPVAMSVLLRPAFAEPADASTNGALQAVPAMGVLFGFFLGPYLANTIFRDHMLAVWPRLRASITTPSDCVAAKVIVAVLLGAGQHCVLIAVGFVFLDFRSRGSYALLAVVAAASTLCFVSFGLAAAATCRTFGQLAAVSAAAGIAFAGLGGALSSQSALPAAAQHLAPLTPSYWAMRANRVVVSNGSDVATVALSLTMLFLFSILFLAVAIVGFRRDKKKSWS
jgi:ABC-2 type transport system permease protein